MGVRHTVAAEGRKSDTVIGVGDVLTKRLEQKNIKVVHDRNI